MVFSSMIFLCGFLPIVLLIYRVLPERLRNLWLLLASLFFYGWGEPRYIFIMLFSTVFDYCNGRGIAYVTAKGKHDTWGRFILVISVLGNLGILCFFKYTDFVLKTVNSLTGAGLALLRLTLPIGISFYTFQTMSYTIDVYKGQIPAQKNIVSFGMYVCMFPQLIAGPIVRYRDISAEIGARKLTPDRMALGLQRFMIGLGKKVLLANQIGKLWDDIQGFAAGELTTALAWLGALAYTFEIYYDFSGYSDMALGLGEMLGFHFPENFDHPYESGSITEFWRRWHITLGSWFREYVYIPLGGNRRGLPRQILNLLIVWFLTGLWHGAGWNFILWGLYYFVWLLLEKLVLLRFMERWPRLCRHLYTLMIVIVGWVIFVQEELSCLADYLKAMFCMGVPLISQRSVYEWKVWLLACILLAVGATGIPGIIFRQLTTDKNREPVRMICTIVILFLSLAFLVSGSYNPFLYFRF